MIDFEKALLQEVAALPKSRRADVLAFVRCLRISLMDGDKVEGRYDAAVQEIRETARRYNITDQVIEEEIRAVRGEHARGGRWWVLANTTTGY